MASRDRILAALRRNAPPTVAAPDLAELRPVHLGPSKTADIEQVLVVGAQRARTCTVVVVGSAGNAPG